MTNESECTRHEAAVNVEKLEKAVWPRVTDDDVKMFESEAAGITTLKLVSKTGVWWEDV